MINHLILEVYCLSSWRHCYLNIDVYCVSVFLSCVFIAHELSLTYVTELKKKIGLEVSPVLSQIKIHENLFFSSILPCFNLNLFFTESHYCP